jgi:hypothetical protein
MAEKRRTLGQNALNAGGMKTVLDPYPCLSGQNVPRREFIMIKRLFAIAVVAAAVAASSPAFAQVDFNIVLGSPPPPPRVEIVPPMRVGYAWAPGYWRWEHDHHIWAPGHYIEARRGEHWVADRWSQHRDGWHHDAGHWDHDGERHSWR